MHEFPALPDPEARPTVRVWPEAGQALGLSRSGAYEAASRGEIPTIRIGTKLLVPTARLRAMLGLDGAAKDAA